MSFAMRWSIAMTVFGLIVAGVVWFVTGSIGWAAVGLLGAGVVANALVHPQRR
jgi:hypothetical protein